MGVGCLAVLIVLLGSGAYAGQVLNPSFEATYSGLPAPRPLPASWGRVDHPSFNSKCTNLWRTDGSLSAGLYSKLSNGTGTYVFNPGARQGFRQYMDLTGMSVIAFDVRLAAYPSGEFEHFEASLLVDDIPLWSQTEGGVYLDQTVNVSPFTGWHLVELRLTALDSGAFSLAYWTQWDSIELIEGPTFIEAFIGLDPATLNLASQGNWITCYIELAEGFDATLIDGATVALVVGDEEIPAYIGPESGATPEANEGNISDLNENGVLERMVKFERAAVQEIVQPPEAIVAIQGRLADGTPFEGAAAIRVIDKGGKKK